MSSRSWFYASEGTQQGPYFEVQFRELIAAGTVTPDTLVWSEGMTGWQAAREIPGLLSNGSRPPAFPPSGGALTHAGGPVSIDVGLWELLGRGLVFVFGFLLVIPAPWVATNFYRWMVSRLRVPQRPDLAFTGQPMDIWYVFIGMALLTYVGWYILLILSSITIIGWAWVVTAWMRWNCANIDGTRREIVFNATGLEMLWRTLLFGLGCALLIPIPWAMRWYAQWYVSQFSLEERNA